MADQSVLKQKKVAKKLKTTIVIFHKNCGLSRFSIFAIDLQTINKWLKLDLSSQHYKILFLENLDELWFTTYK